MYLNQAKYVANVALLSFLIGQATPAWSQEATTPPVPAGPRPQPLPGYVPPDPTPPPGAYVVMRIPLRYEDRPRYGLVAAGAATLGGGYFLGLTTGGVLGCLFFGSSACDSIWLRALPVFGPIIQIAQDPQSAPGAVFSGLVQVAGLSLLIAGAVSRHRVPVYAQKLQLSPLLTARGGGLSASLRF